MSDDERVLKHTDRCEWQNRAETAERALTEARAETDRLTKLLAASCSLRDALVDSLGETQMLAMGAIDKARAERDAARAELAALREAVTEIRDGMLADVHRSPRPSPGGYAQLLSAALASPVEPPKGQP